MTTATCKTGLRYAALTLVLTLASLPNEARAQTYTVLHSLNGYGEGSTPISGVTVDRAGNLYGTASTSGTMGFGTVYRMVRNGPSWSYSVLYQFQGFTWTSVDGAAPIARVVIGPDGALFGTTLSGGDGNGCRELHGCGTAFRLLPKPGGIGTWQETILHQFGTFDGEDPNYGDLVFDAAGNVYGATRNGGAYYSGAVYKLTPVNGSWSESVVYSFTGGTDGGRPLSGPTLSNDGSLYGATSVGGAYDLGVVYGLQPSGSGWTAEVLHSFLGGADGLNPSSGVTLDREGDVYGATQGGGISGGGTAFELTRGNGIWNMNTLFGFPANTFGGSYRTLVMDSSGILYGTTAADGAHRCGSVFKLTRRDGAWAYSSLHDFTCGADGGYPYGVLAFDAVGNVYGTASAGGSSGAGVVFEITP